MLPVEYRSLPNPKVFPLPPEIKVKSTEARINTVDMPAIFKVIPPTKYDGLPEAVTMWNMPSGAFLLHLETKTRKEGA